MKQAHVFISGRIQGIGYRNYVKTNARKFGLTGWVRNVEDGGVEIVLQGEEAMVEGMIAECKKGPFMAEVEHIGFEWEDGEETFTDLKIV